MATSTDLKDKIKFIELVHDLLPRESRLEVGLPSLPKDLAAMDEPPRRLALRCPHRFCFAPTR
jgi:hypothetical protein